MKLMTVLSGGFTVVIGVFWGISLIAALGGFMLLCGDMVEGIVGPPEIATIAIGMAVPPFIFARSLYAFVEMERSREMLRLLRKIAEQ